MKVKKFWFVSFILLINLVPAPSTGSTPGTGSHIFDFTLISGESVNTARYLGEPLILDWSASWCDVCEVNLETFKGIWQLYQLNISILTISYGASGDDLDDVIGVKERSIQYKWDFGFDDTNYAAGYDAKNADVWILDFGSRIKSSSIMGLHIC